MKGRLGTFFLVSKLRRWYEFSFASASKRGMGLPITLAAVVLITVLVLAFFNRATINRRISFSSANQIKAQMLAQSSLDLIVSQLRQQIADGSTSGAVYDQNSVTIYSPKDATCLLPKKQPGLNGDVVGAATILYLSAHGATLNPYAAPPLQLGSDVTIDTPSFNGRTQGHWFSEGPQLGSLQGGALPTWVFLTQGNGIATSPVTTAKPMEADYVIGRFAYTVYDISGLLNVNVAGYPAVMDSDTNAYPAFKSSQAYADLSVVSGTAITGDSLSAWRNPAESASAAAYDSYLRDCGFKYGFLQTRVGDNAFFSRRDLLNAAANGIAGLNASSPGYFTSFARSTNAPSWSPEKNAVSIQSGGSASYPYKDNAEVASGTNRNIPNVRFSYGDSNPHSMTHYRDDGTSFEYTVQAGAPLVQHRFSLAKLAWLTPTGPKAGISDDAIQACFGLKWIGGTTEHWEYVGHTGSALQSSIKTLNQIATDIENGRTTEPNFFELLKAGILGGSIGTNSQTATMAGATQITFEKNPDLHILKIGANMVDCAANDNYPTIIAFTSADFEIAGQVDLPYFYSLQSYLPRKSNPANKAAGDMLASCDLCWTPVFFNPTRRMNSLAVPSDDAHSPAAIQADFGSGLLTDIVASGNSTSYSPFVDAVGINKDLKALDPITMPRAQYEDYRNNPQPMTGAEADTNDNSFGSLVPYATGNKSVKTFLLYSYQNEQTDTSAAANWRKYSYLYAYAPAKPVSSVSIWPKFQNVLLRLRYKTPNGNWKTYSTLGGQENYSGIDSQAHTASGVNDSSNGLLQCGPTFDQENISVLGAAAGVYQPGFMLNNFDPRSNRLGPCSSGAASTLPALSSLAPANPASQSYLLTGITRYEPYTSARVSGDANLTLFGLWPQGGKGYASLGSVANPSGYNSTNKITTVFNYPDPDGVFRPADGWLESSVDATNTTNLYTPSNQGISTSSARPILLHRPYRSVAELGYVFRDNAWKSLSFFDATSGDAALLDLFSVADQPAITAGRVNLNTQLMTVHQALFSNACREPDGSSKIPNATASSLSAAYNSYAYSSGAAASTLPADPAQLTRFMSDNSAQIAAAGLGNIKYQREAIVRALAETTQTRTWNLLIDVVAQTGRYPATLTAPNAAKFIVEGEKRYWLSIAIDRFTGKIIDQQLEPVIH